MLGLLRTLVFNVGALCVAYVLCLSGVHKFVYKASSNTHLESIDQADRCWCVRAGGG